MFKISLRACTKMNDVDRTESAFVRGGKRRA